MMEPPPDVCPNFDASRPDHRPAACDVCGVSLHKSEPWTMCVWCDAILHTRCQEDHECPVLEDVSRAPSKETTTDE